MTTRQFGRVLTAMATPFDARGEHVDMRAAEALMVALLESGSDGVVIAGTTGEAPTLSTREKLDLFEMAVHVVKGRGGQVIAGTTNYNTAESIEFSGEVARLGVDGILGTVPYYNNPPQEGLYAHFSAIASAVDGLPMLLYNVPSRTVRNMEAATTLRLARDVRNIVGIKEASGNLTQIGEVIAGAPEHFGVWSGNDADLLPILALGGYGVVSVASHLVGTQLAALIRLHQEGDTVGAADIHHALMPLVNALFATSNPIPLKYALNKIGMRVGPTRLPLVPIDPKSQVIMDAALANIRVDLPVKVPA